ncbi:hypothetical protein TREMEDRAFT_66207 [Tremella mesenterica DSM 1558]|uniref:uncharacterized protein n=1 Tax=Tremella mesenterica (strain ATCC 24925 / CBS 8224 / DSM 1558 / NBRC 9311 / NRRL Y-6157 / RJB 2259-6 / UBC 559-6) TaxID=578456 RepID=UPI00032BD8C4|nr:uncharacterized protein TREMEDRAFT_66207 [Tremella mesenterica DSM 1558]EIW65839.1 hypothetical protein TREMEDRAFT_66207 [Tremella mesenterica DSM 1558]
MSARAKALIGFKRKCQFQPLCRHSSSFSNAESTDIGSQLRNVMRNVPQPVSIAVCRIPSHDHQVEYRGVTLSSFTSLALYPQPLVSFALRLPSRMADCLRPSLPHFSTSQVQSAAPDQHHSRTSRFIQPEIASPSSLQPSDSKSASLFPLDTLQTLSHLLPSSSSQTPNISLSSTSSYKLPSVAANATSNPSSTPTTTSHSTELSISLLSSQYQSLAESLSRPSTDQKEIFDNPQWDKSDIPVLRDSLGWLKCEVVTSIPLGSLITTPTSTSSKQDIGMVLPTSYDSTITSSNEHSTTDRKKEGSELFICKVLSVHLGGGQPLVHLNRRYTTVSDTI